MLALVLACTFVVLPHSIDADERKADTVAPRAAKAEVMKVVRGKGPVAGPNGTMSMSSCDDLGSVAIRLVVPATDDRTVAGEMGYVLEHAGGTLPDGLTLSPEAVRSHNDQIWFTWIDGATDEQEPLDFAVQVVAVDRGGNRSAASDVVWVRDAGKKGD